MTGDTGLARSFALKQGVNRLEGKVDSAPLEAELLLCFALGVERLELIRDIHVLITPDQLSLYRELLDKRVEGLPFAYIVGKREFYGRDFLVSPAVLIPRPETELLVERALEFVKGRSKAGVVDLGTGSGCIASTVAAESGLGVLGIDNSASALEIASKNVHALGLHQKVDLIQANWSECIASESVDLVLCNPPYISDSMRGEFQTILFEPDSALYAGAQGLFHYQKIFADLRRILRPRGSALFEIGDGQFNHLRIIARSLSLPQPILFRDLSGKERVIQFTL